MHLTQVRGDLRKFRPRAVQSRVVLELKEQWESGSIVPMDIN